MERRRGEEEEKGEKNIGDARSTLGYEERREEWRGGRDFLDLSQ